MLRILLVTMSLMTLGGCAWLQDGRDDRLPSAAELCAGDCRPGGPQDPVAPGEWICDTGDGDERVQPRHRVEDH